MEKNQKELMMKTMTKKEFKKQMAQRRSSVGRDQNLGTRTMKSARDFDRKKAARELREILRKDVVFD